MKRHLLLYSLLILAVSFTLGLSTVRAQSLGAELQQVPPAELVRAARQSGDAARGAVVFFQPQMACSKCHVVENKDGNLLGPDLSKLDRTTTDEMLVESVLWPSKSIRKGFETTSILTTDGQTIAAFLVQQAKDKVVVRDVSRQGALVTIARDDIEAIRASELSIMPAGQIDQLNSRQQFLDLMRYLMEIRDGGAARAMQLQPAASLLVFTIPEYEKHIDHAGLIGKWNRESRRRGQAIYQRVCANCHGTKDQPGSLPTSLRFAQGKFKNGSDPLSMYRTLTHGFGLMTPQTWMVPSQKYDVIHYIRETYLKADNPSQYAAIDQAYLDRLPKGDTFGPEPSKIEPWSAMDYGPSLAHTFEVPASKHNFAYKGIAVRLDPGAGGISRGRHWMLFDTDTLRVAAGWNAEAPKPSATLANSDNSKEEANSQDKDKSNAKDKANKKDSTKDKVNDQASNFIDWKGIQFNGAHGVHPKLVGQVDFTNTTGPGWANPETGQFTDDQRVLGRDGKRYGPLPRQWGRYKGLYHHGQNVIFSYSIGSTDILEMPRLQARTESQPPRWLRTFNIAPRDRDLWLQVADQTVDDLTSSSPREAGFAPRTLDAQWKVVDGKLLLRIPAGQQPLRFTIWQLADVANNSSKAESTAVGNSQLDGRPTSEPVIDNVDLDLSGLTKGGPPRWPQILTTQATTGADNGPFAVDVLTAPESNPWLAQLRFTGLDFFNDGRIAVCSWDGDVWIVTPSVAPTDTSLRWQRIATGLFQPLGLKIIAGKIHLTCRDQLAVLHDLNADGEIDFYECLNNDHQVTEHFHEFAMGLQTDAAGNFYYAKSGCHGKAAVVPHHGTLLRVSPDGTSTTILANGFRAANGVCLNPDGTFFVTDQEGFWNPKNRINWVTVSKSAQPNFYGNMLGYHDVTDSSDSAMIPPLCWITNEFDRSPAELLWVDSDRWGPLKGSLLNLSYGYGKVFLVPHEQVQGKMQGGMIQLPIPTFPTGVMRGRFHPTDGQLYLCGMFAWAGNATHPGALYRLRATGQPSYLPIQLQAQKSGLKLTFTEPIDPASLDVQMISVKTWSLKRTADYGSKHFDERYLNVRSASLSQDGETVTLDVADLQPTWCMEIKYAFRSSAGTPVQGTLHNTIHELAD